MTEPTTPATAAGRALLDETRFAWSEGSFLDPVNMASAILRIEAEARAAAPDTRALGVQRVLEIMRRHTHYDRIWVMSMHAGQDTSADCLLCRALVDAGVLTLDGIGAGTRAAIERERAAFAAAGAAERDEHA